MDAISERMSKIQWSYGDKDQAALAILERRIADAGRRLGFVTYSDLVNGVEFHLPNINNGGVYRIATHDWTGLDRRIVGDFLESVTNFSWWICVFLVWKLQENRTLPTCPMMNGRLSCRI